jgi:ATP-dependent 26S proteasome regulatory subunit
MPRSTSLASSLWVSRHSYKIDEIDAIGGRRFSEGTSADREIQRTLMELLNQMDGFDYLGQTKLIMVRDTFF